MGDRAIASGNGPSERVFECLMRELMGAFRSFLDGQAFRDPCRESRGEGASCSVCVSKIEMRRGE